MRRASAKSMSQPFGQREFCRGFAAGVSKRQAARRAPSVALAINGVRSSFGEQLVPAARGPDAQPSSPARWIACRKTLFQAFINIELGDGVLPRLSHCCREALAFLVLRAPCRRTARTGRWIGHVSAPAFIMIAPRPSA